MLRSSLARPLRRFPTSPAWRTIHRQSPQHNAEPQEPQTQSTQEGNSSKPGADDVVPPPSSTSTSPSSSPGLTSSTDTNANDAPAAGQRAFPPLLSSMTKDEGPNAPSSMSAYDLDLVKQRIREWTEKTAIVIRNRADDFTASTKTTFSQLGAHLNKVTGYEEIEALKRDVVQQEHRINETRRAARQAKMAYEEAVIQRSKSQREVNDLLQRKSSWTDADVSRFTTLVRQDHLYEQEELRAKTAVDESEDAVEKEFSQLMQLILARYHEEQVWSDKIRSASTYGQLAALGLNLLVFVLAIIVVEPWKRKRLAQTFERKIEELSEEYAVKLEQSMGKIQGALVGQETLLVSLAEQVANAAEVAESKPQMPPPPPPYVPAEVVSLPSKPPLDSLDRRTWELVTVGAGAFVVGILGSLLFSR